MEKQRNCQRCGRNNEIINIFCNYCGYKFDQEVKNKKGRQLAELIPGKQSNKTMISMVGGLGIIIIGISLYQILETPELEIDPDLISLLGFIFFVILLLTSVMLRIKTEVDQLTPIFLMILSEIILLVSQFMLDFLQRTYLSRNLLLWSAILISGIGTLSALIFTDSQFQQIHRIGSAYIGWIIIYYVSGSDYISELNITLAVIIQILLMHFIGLVYPTIIVVSVYVSLEFFILLQTKVINSTDIFIVALVIILSVPVILYLKKFPKLVRIEFPPGNNLLIMLYSIPILAIIISITNGALLPPYTHILFALFCISWSVYIFIFRNDIKYRETLQTLSQSMIFLFFVGISIYSFNNSDIELISLHLGLTLAILFLRNILEIKAQTYVKILNLAVTVLVSYQIYVDNYFDFILSLVTFVTSFIIIYGKELYQLKINEFDFIAVFASISFFSSIIYLQHEFSVLLVVGNLLILSLFYALKYKSKYQSRYFSLVIGQVIVILSFFRYADLNNIELIVVVFVILFLFSISHFDRSLPKDLAIIGWLILSLPLILSMNDLLNHYLINTITSTLLVFAFFSINIKAKDYTQQYVPLIFALSSVFGRTITSGELASISDFPVWGFSVIFLFLAFGTLIVIVTNNKSVEIELWQFIVYNAAWLITGLSIIEESKEYDDNRIQSIIIFIILFIFFLQMIFLNFEWNLYKTYTMPHRILAISSLGILSYILLISVSLPQGFQIIWYPIVILLILPSFIREDEQLNQQHKMIWVIGATMNILLLAFENQYSLGISIIGAYFIYLYSSYFRGVFRNLTLEINKLSYLFDLVGFFIFSILTAILVKNNLLDNLFGSGIWVILILQLLAKTIQLKVKIEGLHIIQAMMISYTTVIWLINRKFEFILLPIGLLLSLIFIFLDKNILFERTSTGIIPSFTETTLAFSSYIFAQIIGISWIIVRNEILSIDQLFRYIAFFMFLILVCSIILERFYAKNTLSDSLIITSFLLTITSSLIGHFETSLSNLILALLAISISIMSVLIREHKLFLIGLGISGISLIKGIMDLIILDNLERSISLLVLGVQAVWYAIVYNSFQDRFSNQSILNLIEK